jgi:hypothetical protein
LNERYDLGSYLLWKILIIDVDNINFVTTQDLRIILNKIDARNGCFTQISLQKKEEQTTIKKPPI